MRAAHWGCCSWLLIFWGNILSEDMKRIFRNANIGIAFGALVLAVGFPLLYDDEGAVELLALGAFAVVMSVYLFLERRDDRARPRDDHRSP